MTASTPDNGRSRTRAKRPNVELLDRQPPADLDAERAVLGSILLDPRRLAEVRELVGPEHFYEDRHEAVFRHLLRLVNNGNGVDVITLRDSLKAAGELKLAGGAAYLADVLQSVPVAAHAAYYAGIVREKADRRVLLRLCERGLQLAHGDGDLQNVREELAELLDPEAGKPPEPPPFTRLLSSAELVQLDQKLHFLVDKIMVEGQPMVIGARSKSLKTSLAIDLAISLGSGTPFLGRFDSQQASIGFWSGESGAATIKETALRVAKSKGVNLADCSVHWSFDLPRLSQGDHLDVLRSIIRDRGIKIALFDPLYLCLLSGDTAGTASNIFAMGSVLQPFSEFTQEAGVTPGLVHHFRKTGQVDPQEPAGLEELAQSGIAEWARQWLLIQRRVPYQDDGHHELWLHAGGSAGHSALWALTVDEGSNDDPGGRRWQVSLDNPANAREAVEAKLQQTKDAKDVEVLEKDEARIVRTMLKVGTETRSNIRNASGVRDARFQVAFANLIQDGHVVACELTRPNRKAPYTAYKLVEG